VARGSEHDVGRPPGAEARTAYGRALELAGSDAELRFLERRSAELNFTL